jgi:Chaperone of endosialidase
MKIYTLNPLTTTVNPTNRGKRKNLMLGQLNSQKRVVAPGSGLSTHPFRLAFLLAGLALVGLALAPGARAACREGCDPTLENAFLGDDALVNNTTGQFNTATGFEALFSNTAGQDNTATGTFALFPNTTGSGNTADGSGAMGSNTTGFNNTAIGVKALNSATTPNENTALGAGALRFDNTGANNTGIGVNALYNNSTGSGNTAVGHFAGINLTTGSNDIYIGNAGGSGGESNRIRIGTVGTQTTTFIAGISGATVPGGVGVIVGTNGKLGTVVSSERFKDEIKPMDNASETIFALKPVTFRYKQELDPVGIPQFGLVAEDVEKVNPDLVARDDQGKAYSVRYEAVNAMLLNEFLKEHRTVEEQKATIGELNLALAQQQKEIKVLTTGLQKVNNQLEMAKPAPRVVANN